MRVYLLTEADFERLMLRLQQDPTQRLSAQTDAEWQMHVDAFRFFNYQIQKWLAEVKEDKRG
jgi:uncharacterized protein with PIN domain